MKKNRVRKSRDTAPLRHNNAGQKSLLEKITYCIVIITVIIAPFFNEQYASMLYCMYCITNYYLKTKADDFENFKINTLKQNKRSKESVKLSGKKVRWE